VPRNQEFKYQIHPTQGVSRTGGPKQKLPFQISPNGPVYEHVHDPEIVKDIKQPRENRGLMRKLGDFNMRIWGQ
jgi:hypothetical protein